MLQRKETVNTTPAQRWGRLAGKVFRRKDLSNELPSIDREVGLAVKAGTVRKAARGLYYVPGKPRLAMHRQARKRLSRSLSMTVIHSRCAHFLADNEHDL